MIVVYYFLGLMCVVLIAMLISIVNSRMKTTYYCECGAVVSPSANRCPKCHGKIEGVYDVILKDHKKLVKAS